jgi:hypothetical protein
MASKRFSPTALLLLLFAAVSAPSQKLPDAPGPPLHPASGPGESPPSIHSSDTHSYAPSRWYGVVDHDEKVPPLYARDKMMFWVHEDMSPIGWAPGLLATGWSQLLVSDPNYGSDSAAFGERVGAAVLRDTSMRFFSDSLIPTLAHEDPRYFRKAYGGIKERGVYAAERVFVDQRDDGTRGFNFSDTVGHLAASALTPTYYPARSANGRVVMTTWAYSLLGDAGGNIFAEFWLDIRDAIFHRHRKP